MYCTTVELYGNASVFPLSYAAVTVGFEQATYLVGESASFLLYHVHVWGWLERDVVVNITATDGSAIRELLLLMMVFCFSNRLVLRAPCLTVGEDFMEPENASITLSSGLHGHYSLWLRVFIVGDILYEGDENFFLVLSSNDTAAVFNQSMTEVTIADDDPGKCCGAAVRATAV